MPRVSKVFKKVKKRGNQYYSNTPVEGLILPSEEISLDCQNEVEVSPRPRLTNSDDRPNLHPGTSTPLSSACSSSRKKILSSGGSLDSSLASVSPSSEEECVPTGYQLIDMDILSSAIQQFTSCKACGSEGCVRLVEEVKERKGLCTSLVLKCTNCVEIHKFKNSRQTEEGAEVNIRFVYGLRSIGRGQRPGKMLCSIMGLPKPLTKFGPTNKAVGKAISVVADSSTKAAVKEAIQENVENENPKDLVIAVDGTWQKRGHTSHNGVVTITSVDTGKVLDVQCLTNYCQGCTLNRTGKKKEAHESVCVKNYEGSSGGMEAAGVVRIFHRSLETRGVRYTKFLGDGDSKAHKCVVESVPYGHGVDIEKLECVGHVQKRMGSRLRRLKKEYKGKNLSDGKFLSGHGRLTDKEIDSIQNYYGQAIRGNTSDLKQMKQAIWAIYFHKASTDEEPQHELCPKGSTSWCRYNKSLVTGQQYSHKHSLPHPVLECMKSTFRDLTNDELLKKCLHGNTQNVNESFNNTVWLRCPKTVYVGLEVLELGTLDAVISFNDGHAGKVKVLEELGCVPGANTIKQLQEIDNERVRKADAATTAICKQARKKKRNTKRKKDEEEEPDYGPGIA